MVQSKRYIANLEKVNRDKEYGLDEAAAFRLQTFSNNLFFLESVKMAHVMRLPLLMQRKASK